MGIPLEVFVRLRAETEELASLRNKAEEMIAMYKCFNLEHQRNFVKKPTLLVKSNTVIPQIKKQILSKEVIARKEFLMFANKLSKTNKHVMIEGMRKIKRSECVDIYFDVFFDLMLRSDEYQDLYIEFIKESLTLPDNIFKDKIKNYFNNYLDRRKWYPSDTQVQEDYDSFCDFQKLRKQSINAIMSFDKYVKYNFISTQDVCALTSAMVSDTINELTVQNYKIADYLLDILLKFDTVNVDITPIGKFDILKPSTKFKIEDLFNRWIKQT